MSDMHERAAGVVARLAGKSWYTVDSTGARFVDDAPQDAMWLLLTMSAELAEVRNLALEEAAKACDRRAGNASDFDRYTRRAAGMCASDIRAMKGHL